jgi:hypothetical protein
MNEQELLTEIASLKQHVAGLENQLRIICNTVNK